jgi:hypothetical protein
MLFLNLELKTIRGTLMLQSGGKFTCISLIILYKILFKLLSPTYKSKIQFFKNIK